MMRLSPRGHTFIQQQEGLRLVAYPDGAGYSVGYGHHGVTPETVVTKAEAEALFAADVQRFEQAVNANAPGGSQAMFDAMVSLAYNIGAPAFGASTLARLHRAGDYDGAAREFPRWVYSQGKVLPVLERRRKAEQALYTSELAPELPSSAGWAWALAPIGLFFCGVESERAV